MLDPNHTQLNLAWKLFSVLLNWNCCSCALVLPYEWFSPSFSHQHWAPPAILPTSLWLHLLTGSQGEMPQLREPQGPFPGAAVPAGDTSHGSGRDCSLACSALGTWKEGEIQVMACLKWMAGSCCGADFSWGSIILIPCKSYQIMLNNYTQFCA